MSDPEKKTEKKTDEKNELIEANVALVLSENKSLMDELEKEKALVADLTKRLSQATDLIEEDSKARLISEIAPKTSVPKDMLARKTVADLKTMKETLDRANIAAFKSGTPMVDSKKPSLDNIFGEFMGSLRSKGGN